LCEFINSSGEHERGEKKNPLNLGSYAVHLKKRIEAISETEQFISVKPKIRVLDNSPLILNLKILQFY
jgi:hypothetical protein